MAARLDHFAARLGGDPFFLAAALATYAASVHCDDAHLAGRLHCPVETLTPLRMCRMPRSQAPDFWNDIETIAGRFAVDAEALAEVVRHGQTLLRLQAAAPPDPTRGTLLAARDRPAEGTAPEEKS